MTGFLVSVTAACCLLPGGCLPIDGGAIEGWFDFRNATGERIGCPGAAERAGLAALRLVLLPEGGGGDPCARDSRCAFACSGGTDEILLASTPFMIPEGSYSITSRGVDSAGQELSAPDGVVPPPPVVLPVRDGLVTDLNVNLIIVYP